MLVVYPVQEVVSMGAFEHPDPTALEAAVAPHVAPQQFHTLLEQAADEQKPTVLLDVRNLYETRVGHFAKVGRCMMQTLYRQGCGVPIPIAKRITLPLCKQTSSFLMKLGCSWADRRPAAGSAAAMFWRCAGLAG